MSVFHDHPVRQLGYFVPDVVSAATRHSELFGSGPFFKFDMNPASSYRGTSGTHLDLSVALGQWGGQMVEFIQQKDDNPSVFYDIYPRGSGRFGFHHMALIVDDLERAIVSMERTGHFVAGRCSPEPGYEAVFMDTHEGYGHFIELFESIPQVMDAFAFIAAAAGDFGEGPVRTVAGF